MKEKLGFGCLGNGTTVWDSSRERNNDYVTVAHISDDGSEINIRETISMEARNAIERDAIRTFKKKYSDDSSIPVIIMHEWNRKIKLEIKAWLPSEINRRYIEHLDILYKYVSLLHPITYGVGKNQIKLYDIEDNSDKYAIDFGSESTLRFKTFNEAYYCFIQKIGNK